MRLTNMLAPLLLCGCAIIVPPEKGEEKALPALVAPWLAPAPVAPSVAPKAAPLPSPTSMRVGHVVLITSTPKPSPTPTPKELTPFDLYPSNFPYPLPSNMCDEAFSRIDANHNGFLSEDEYVRVGLSKRLFRKDVDQNRELSRFRYGLYWCGSGIDPK